MESYAKAKKLTPVREGFPEFSHFSHTQSQEYERTYKTLQVLPSGFPQMLNALGFDEVASYAIGGEESHGRSIMVFKKVEFKGVPPY